METICNYCLKFNQRELKYTLKNARWQGMKNWHDIIWDDEIKNANL